MRTALSALVGLFVGAAVGFAAGYFVGGAKAKFQEVCRMLGPDCSTTETSERAGGERRVRIPKDSKGRFAVESVINGHRVPFLIDTGASVIALRSTAAQTIGINPKPSEFTAEVKTAAGTVKAAPVELETVSVEGIVVNKVKALVVPDNALSDNLLGFSYLAKLKHFEYRDGALELGQ